MSTRFYKGNHGWAGETKVALGITRRDDFKKVDMPLFLTVNTWKDDMRGGIYSHAAVHAEYGSSIVFEVAGDFTETIERDKAARCTQKTIGEMHARAESKLAEIMERAKAFYAKKTVQAA